MNSNGQGDVTPPLANTPNVTPRAEEGAVENAVKAKADAAITKVTVHRGDKERTEYSNFSNPTVTKFDSKGIEITETEVSAAAPGAGGVIKIKGGGNLRKGGPKSASTGGKKSRKPKSKKRRVRKTRRRKH